MAKRHLRGQRQQRVKLSCRRILRAHAQSLSGSPQQRGIARRLGGGHQGQRLRRRGQVSRLTHEPAAQRRPHRQRIGKKAPADPLLGSQLGRELDQRQRVARSPTDELRPHRRAQGPIRDPVENGVRGRVGERREPQPGKAEQLGRWSVGIPQREDHRHTDGVEPAGDEGEQLQRVAIEPLRVVDDTQQGSDRGRVSQQRADGQPDQEAVGGHPSGDPERASQRIRLRRGQVPDSPEKRRDQLVHPRIAQRDLGLDTDDARAPEADRGIDRVIKERRLADPRLATEHHRPRLAPYHAGEQTCQLPSLLRAADEGHAAQVRQLAYECRRACVIEAGVQPRGSTPNSEPQADRRRRWQAADNCARVKGRSAVSVRHRTRPVRAVVMPQPR